VAVHDFVDGFRVGATGDVDGSTDLFKVCATDGAAVEDGESAGYFAMQVLMVMDLPAKDDE